MAGRPSAPLCITPNVNEPAQLLECDFNHRQLVMITADNKAAIQFLASYHLLHNRVDCDICHSPCAFSKYAQVSIHHL